MDSDYVYSGENCETKVEKLALSSTNIIAIAAGTGSAVVVVLVIIIIILVVKFRKAKKER